MIGCDKFVDALKKNGVDTIIGLPCSSFAGVLRAVEEDPELDYIAVTSEAEAVGIAAGVWLANRSPAIMIQNSGFCDAINPISSLLDTFAIPVPFFVSVRGGFGVKDEPQHKLIGGQFVPVVESLGLGCHVLRGEEEEIAGTIDALFRDEIKRGRTGIAAVPVGTFVAPAPVAAGAVGGGDDGHCGSRSDVLAVIRRSAPEDSIFVCSTGYIGRDLYALGDGPNQLYVAGSMGCASAIGFGISRNTERTVIVLDGDGAALMRMGNCATIANGEPGRLIHVVLNNGVYESTGGQLNYARQVDFAAVAKACGYSKDSTRIASLAALEQFFAGFAESDGAKPILVDTLIAARSPPPTVRPSVSYPDQAVRLQRMLGEQ